MKDLKAEMAVGHLDALLNIELLKWTFMVIQVEFGAPIIPSFSIYACYISYSMYTASICAEVSYYCKEVG